MFGCLGTLKVRGGGYVCHAHLVPLGELLLFWISWA